MQHANILTPSGFASVWECVFIPAAWVSLWIHFTSVTERCQLVYSRLGERRGPRFYRGFCSLSRCPISLFMQQPLTGLGSVILKRTREQLPCFTVSERCLIRRVIQFIFNIWMKVLFSHLNGSCCRCEVWIYVFPSSRHDVNPQQK